MDGDKVLLPHLEGVDDTVLMDSHCVLSDKPAAPGCVVVLVEFSANTLIWYCHPGDDQWVKYEYDVGTQVLPYPGEEDQYEKIVICTMAPCHGKFYFNCLTTEIGVLDFNNHPEPVASIITVDDTIADDGSYGCEFRPCLAFLVESDGELFMVRLLYLDRDKNIEKASVHRMDFSALRWRNVSDLGGRSFLVSRYYFGASCCPVGDRGVLPDCIYIVCPRSNSLQVFSVKEGTRELQELNEAPDVDKAFWLFSANP